MALHLYPEQNKGEMGYLFVSPSHENQGIGRKLLLAGRDHLFGNDRVAVLDRELDVHQADDAEPEREGGPQARRQHGRRGEGGHEGDDRRDRHDRPRPLPRRGTRRRPWP